MGMRIALRVGNLADLTNVTNALGAVALVAHGEVKGNLKEEVRNSLGSPRLLLNRIQCTLPKWVPNLRILGKNTRKSRLQVASREMVP